MRDGLDDLFRAARGRLRTVPPEMTKVYYGSTYKGLIDLLKTYGVLHAPSLHVISSPYAFTEFLRTSSQTWIVYDQFLGQIFSRLSALVDQRAELSSIDAYLTKLHADRLLVAGRGREALLVALVHQELRKNDAFKGVPDYARLKSVQAQETFTLAHELTHFALSTSASFKKFWFDTYFALVAIAEEIHTELSQGLTDVSLAESLADDFNREYIRRYGAQDEAMLASGRQQLVEGYLRNNVDVSEYGLLALRNDPVLAEEAVCDGVAAVLTAQLLGGDELEQMRRVFASCLRATQHLRLLKSMDARIAGENIGTKGMLLGGTTRGHCLRLFLRALFESDACSIFFGMPSGVTSQEGEVDALLTDLRDVNMTFYEKVFDAVLTGSFYDRFHGASEEDRRAIDQARSALPNKTESWGIAAQLIGF